MDPTRRLLPLGLAGLAATVGTAAACDPDALDTHSAEMCDGPLSLARATVEAALPHATDAERHAMLRALTVDGTVCTQGDPMDGTRIASTLVRMAGRIEGRVGLPPGGLDPLEQYPTGWNHPVGFLALENISSRAAYFRSAEPLRGSIRPDAALT
jgi:hypothetical protein